MLTKMRRLYSLYFILCVMSCGPLFAQRDAASLEGRIVDTSGAIIPRATVTATETSTKFTYRATSDSSGAWTISPVCRGPYRVSSSAPGFKTNIEGPITLDVQQRQRVDATLQPGEVSQTVEVHDDAPLLQTDTSETGQIVAAKTIVGLPLNGRNSVQLAQLTVGVTVSEPGARDVTSFGFSASGARSLDNNFLFAAPGPQNFNNSTVFGTPTFGYVTGAQAPRLLQFAAKLYY